jgi:lysozyme
MYTIGNDVSIWQDVDSTPQMVDFSKMLAAGSRFVFVKASQWARLDGDFVFNWANAKRAGILRGAYHFIDPTYPPTGVHVNEWARTQARFFWGALANDPGELPAVVDCEKAGALTRAQYQEFLKAFIGEWNVITRKRKLIIYTSAGFWASYGSTEVFWAGFDLWLAQYTLAASPALPKPWTRWVFWQYSAVGPGPTYGAESKGIDMNRFNGSEAELYAYAGATPPEPQEPTDAEKLRRLWEAHPDLH